MKQTRSRHSQTYKDVAQALAERIGVTRVPSTSSTHLSYGWRCKLQRQTRSEHEQTLIYEKVGISSHRDRFPPPE